MAFFHTRKSSGLPSSLTVILLVLAFTLQSLIPAGFMPGTGGGFTKLVICSGMGEKTVFIPTDEGNPAEQDGAGSACAYQFAAAHKLLAAPPLASLSVPPLERTGKITSHASFTAFQTVHAFAARGPPAI
ncbi:MAG: DUF2946 family protein [Micavibrio sp.]